MSNGKVNIGGTQKQKLYTVVVGTTQPPNPSENTIWVKTTKTFSNIVFTDEIPLTCDVGILYLTFKDVRGKIEFGEINKRFKTGAQYSDTLYFLNKTGIQTDKTPAGYFDIFKDGMVKTSALFIGAYNNENGVVKGLEFNTYKGNQWERFGKTIMFVNPQNKLQILNEDYTLGPTFETRFMRYAMGQNTFYNYDANHGEPVYCAALDAYVTATQWGVDYQMVTINIIKNSKVIKVINATLPMKFYSSSLMMHFVAGKYMVIGNSENRQNCCVNLETGLVETNIVYAGQSHMMGVEARGDKKFILGYYATGSRSAYYGCSRVNIYRTKYNEANGNAVSEQVLFTDYGSYISGTMMCMMPYEYNDLMIIPHNVIYNKVTGNCVFIKIHSANDHVPDRYSHHFIYNGKLYEKYQYIIPNQNGNIYEWVWSITDLATLTTTYKHKFVNDDYKIINVDRYGNIWGLTLNKVAKLEFNEVTKTFKEVAIIQVPTLDPRFIGENIFQVLNLGVK